MNFAVGIFLLCAVVATNAQAIPVNPFVAANPYAMAFNPYLSGIFGGTSGGAAGLGGIGGSVGTSGSPAFGGFSISVLFQTIVLQKEADRLLTQPNFPADLTQRVQDVLTNAQQNIANCDNVAIPWLQIRCAKQPLTVAKNELKVIDDEWQARQASSTIASSTAAAA